MGAIRSVLLCDRAIDASDAGEVVIASVCRAIGIDFRGQQQRLQRSQWATVAMMATVAADGRVREQIALPWRQVPMWLATIDASRVRNPEARAVLVRFQREAMAALEAHFLGPRHQDDEPMTTRRFARETWGIERFHSGIARMAAQALRADGWVRVRRRVQGRKKYLWFRAGSPDSLPAKTAKSSLTCSVNTEKVSSVEATGGRIMSKLEILKVKEVAKILRCSENKVLQMAKRGRDPLPALRDRGTVRFEKSLVEAWVLRQMGGER